MSSKWFVNGDSSSDLILFFPAFAITEVRTVLFFRSLHSDLKLRLSPLLTSNAQELLKLADFLEYDSRVQYGSRVLSIEELCYNFGYSPNAIFRRLYKLKLAGFPIEISPLTVEFVG
jgi:hypothetical protein